MGGFFLWEIRAERPFALDESRSFKQLSISYGVVGLRGGDDIALDCHNDLQPESSTIRQAEALTWNLQS